MAGATESHSLGHYRIVEKIGQGGMGVVYRAWDAHLERDVAIKMLPPGFFGDDLARHRLRREALALSRLNHPNIGIVHDFDSQGGSDFIVMEYIDGDTLSRRIRDGPLSQEEVVRLGVQLCDGLQAAHDKGLVHRDIKPGNLMVTADDQLKILDFGLAYAQSSVSESAATLTKSRGHPGTPLYMAPEQITGAPVDPRTDVHAVGSVLYEMATGSRPFRGDRPLELAYEVVHSRPSPPRRRNRKISSGLEAVILRALEKRPARRYQSVRELATALEASSTSSWTPLRLPPALGGRRAFWLTTLLLAVVATAAVWSLWPTADPVATGPPDRLRMGVMLPRPPPQGTHSEWPALIQTLLAQGLTGGDGIAVVDPFSLNGQLESAFGSSLPPRNGTLHGVLAGQGIDLVVDGRLDLDGAGFRVVANLVDPSTGEVRLTTGGTFDRESDLPGAVRELSEKIRGFVQVELLGIEEHRDLGPWIASWERDVEAIKSFMLASRYAHRYEPGAGPHLERAVELDPDFIAPRVWLVPALARAGLRDEAEAHYRHLLTLEAGARPFEQAMIAWTGAHLEGDLPAQRRHLEVALGYSPDNFILLANLAETRYEMGDYAGATEAALPTIEAGWRFPGVYATAGKALILLDRKDEAAAVLAQALQISSVDPEVYGLLEATSIANGDDEGAIRYRQLLDARVAASGSEVELEAVYDALADRCDARGEGERSAALRERAPVQTEDE